MARMMPSEDRARVEAAVVDAEANSAAELVVVLAPRAASHLAAAQRFGAWVAGVALFVLATMDRVIPVLAGLGAALGAGVLATRVAYGSRRLLRWLVPAPARREAARRRAKLCFHDEALTGTRDRTGVLLLHAALEDELVILVDVGVTRALGEPALLEIEEVYRRTPGTTADRLVAVVEELGRSLGEVLPRGVDDRDELGNAVRVLEG